jgi:hypothetical protein
VDYKRYSKDEKGKYKNDETGNPEIVVELDPTPAIQIHVGIFQSSPRALSLRRCGFCVVRPAARVLGMTLQVQNIWIIL